MPLPTRITLPPSGRPVGGLLQAARPLEGEWWRGAKFSSTQCTSPQVTGACDDGEVTKAQQRPGEEATFDAFNVLHAIECTTMGGTDVVALAEASLDVTREFAVARELLTGTASGNPSLASATDLGTATDAVAALGCLDQKAAEALSGRLAFIHASPAILNAWMAASAIRLDGRTWRTAFGSVVVASAGYDGRSPGGAAPADGASLYAYATGEVYAAFGNRQTLDSVERSTNTRQAWSEEAALVVFDPCFAIAVDTGVDLCALS